MKESPQTRKGGGDYVVNDDSNHEHKDEDVNKKDQPHAHKRVRRALKQPKMVCYLHIRVSIERDVYI